MAMLNYRRILTGLTAAGLALCAALARADDQHVVSLTCRGMEVQKAIRILQTVSDLRVLVDPKVPHKRITLSLKDLPAEDALKTVVAAAGLSYRKFGNAFLVEPKGGGTLSMDRAGAALAAGGMATNAAGAAPGLGGIVHPDASEPAPVIGGRAPSPQAAVVVSPEVLAALERTVDVDVKNGPLTEVMAQLSRSAGIKVTADPGLSAGLVATVGLHGIPLKSALELVAGQTGLQISPRPDGVAFVTPGLSLDAAQARMPRAPSRAKRVEQGQLWTAEWVHVLTSGFSAFDESNALRSLRRQTVNPDGRSLAFEPRSGSLHRLAPAARGPAPALPRPPPAHRLKSKDAGKQSAHPSTRSVACPHCGQLVPLKAGLKCAACGRVLTPGTRRCPACGGKPVRAILMPARCPHCREPLGRRQVRTG